MLDAHHYVILSSIIFCIGLGGVIFNRRNLLVILMALELLLLAVNMNFVAFSVLFNDLTGQVFTLFVLTIAAAEAAIGLAILIVYYRARRNLYIEDLSELKG